MARGLRVIAGTAGGRRLKSPPGATRPTTDRVKEALFGMLGPERLDGAVVLDLYAGSGALGIEALSRGAASAVFVEQDPASVAVIKANLATTGFDASARVVRSGVSAYLRRGAPGTAFDLVLADPPYDLAAPDLDDVLAVLAAPGRLAPGALVVLERRKGSAPPELPRGWATRGDRAYGDTLLVVMAPPVVAA